MRLLFEPTGLKRIGNVQSSSNDVRLVKGNKSFFLLVQKHKKLLKGEQLKEMGFMYLSPYVDVSRILNSSQAELRRRLLEEQVTVPI